MKSTAVPNYNYTFLDRSLTRHAGQNGVQKAQNLNFVIMNLIQETQNEKMRALGEMGGSQFYNMLFTFSAPKLWKIGYKSDTLGVFACEVRFDILSCNNKKTSLVAIYRENLVIRLPST